SSDSSTIALSHSGTNLNLSWNYLPTDQIFTSSAGGNQPGAIDQVYVFYKVNGEAELRSATREHSSVDCEKIEALGFTKVMPTTPTTPTVSISGISSSDKSNIAMAYCAVSGGKYLEGHVIYNYLSNSNITKMMIAGDLTLDETEAVCAPFDFKIVDGSGNQIGRAHV